MDVHVVLLMFFALYESSAGSMITFELEDRSVQCFFNTLSKGTVYYLDFQVLSGGNYDVDFTLFGPDKRIIKNLQRASYESITIDDTVDGDYKACFGNAFSAMTHKVVFFSWYNASEMEETYGSQVGPDTLFALTTRQIGLNLHNITATQQRERMIHTISYNFGLQLNSRVLYWSIGHSLLVILVGIGQVFLLRSFFSTPTTRHTAPASGSTGPMRYGF
ncbi:Transmembrane emp24 domain-containing protein 7 [Clonorchis sinensis]|uniref:Transmembrane emp24 domain-containing protein 7 n=1 Tax=Clonorchis sinensis TaxID=79923 RepID=A0A8T1LVY1_CLOSI|nr:Transmembrane emp24 domain-containing protein 7 [Clonorchis sinensis]